MNSNPKIKSIPTVLHTKVDCDICTNEVLSSSMIRCPFCVFSACRSCTDTFLMGIDDTKPRCMSLSCKKVWTYEFLASNFPPSFHNKRYRDRRADLILQREKSLMPGTQELVRREKIRKKASLEINDLVDDNNMLRALIKINDIKIKNIKSANYFEDIKTVNKTFTRACPVEECRGFLSQSLKCGICDIYACKDCHLPKNGKHDNDHKCNPDLVATVKMLASDTKPCPACAIPIFKIQGCDQMYCTQCHTAFSWLKGTIETGVIHNPHFYEFQRQQNGGIAPRVQGDMRCGGPPTMIQITSAIEYAQIQITDEIYNAHRLIGHITNTEIRNFPNTTGDIDNSYLRVQYLMNRITEKQLVSKLKQRTKKQEKDCEFNMILTMFTSTMSDLFGNIASGNSSNIPEYLVDMCELRTYTNCQLAKIGERFGNVYPYIDEKWAYWTNALKLGKKTNYVEPRHDDSYDESDDDIGDY
jgi:hypothetical protein